MVRWPIGLLSPALAIVALATPGCFTRPPLVEEIARFAQSTAGYELPQPTQRKLVAAYRAHSADLTAADAEFLLDELYQTGLEGEDLADAFGLAADAGHGTASAAGTVRIVFLTSVQAPSADQLLQVLRARRDASKADASERLAVRGTEALVTWKYGPEDIAAYLSGLPVAKSAGNEKAGLIIYKNTVKLPLTATLRRQIQEAGLAAVSRKVDVGVFGKFMHLLVTSRLPKNEVVAYLRYLGRAGSDKISLDGLARGYDAIEDVSLPPKRRLELFEGVVAALGAGAHPDDVEAALNALRDAPVKITTLDSMATLTLRTMASYPSDLVAAAVERVMGEDVEGEALAERLATALSRVAAGGRRRPALR